MKYSNCAHVYVQIYSLEWGHTKMPTDLCINTNISVLDPAQQLAHARYVSSETDDSPDTIVQVIGTLMNSYG